jgi:hypothetical protein
MAKPQIWVGNHDKQHGGCREATKQGRLQDAQHSGDLLQCYNWITKPSHYFWRVWTVQSSNQATYQSSQHAFPALPCVDKSESETGRISQVPTTTIGHTTKPTDAGLCKMDLAPLSWVKMLWKSLHHFNIQLHMSFPTIPNLREQDHAIMDILFSQDLGSESIQSLNRCRGAMKAIFLSDISTADGRYLENFVFNPGAATAGSKYILPQEKPTRKDWDPWIDFWHGYTTTGGKLKMPLGNWNNATHQVWQWY